MSTLDARLRETFADVFETDVASIPDDISVENSTAWDSMRAIVLASTIESEYGVEFSDEELVKLNSYQRIRESLVDKGVS